MIVCNSCGFQNLDSDAFCGSCGGFLEWTGEVVKPPQAEVPEAEPAKKKSSDTAKANGKKKSDETGKKPVSKGLTKKKPR